MTILIDQGISPVPKNQTLKETEPSSGDEASIKVDQVFHLTTANGPAPTLFITPPSAAITLPIQANPEKELSAKEALNLVRQDGMQLANLPDTLKRDRWVIRNALSQNGLALQHVPLDLRNEDMVSAAMMGNADAFQFAPEEIRSKLRLILVARIFKPDAVQYATPRGLALLAVHDNGMALQNLDENFRSDPEIVLEAVKHNGLALQFASDSLRADHKIVRTATRENGLALQYAHKDLQANLEIVQGAIQNHPGARQFAHPHLQSLNDHELVLRLTQSDRFDRLMEYLIEGQGKEAEEATKMAEEIQDFVEPRLDELRGDEPKFYFSTEHGKLPRTIHYVPEQNLTLLCFNKKRPAKGKNDEQLGSGGYKHVHEAFDYRTGKVYARVMRFSEVEKRCAELLRDVPGIVKTHATYTYTSPKSGEKKLVAIQEKLCKTQYHKLNRNQKVKAVRALLKTIEEMHSRGVFHGDLYQRNLLFNQDLQFTILDFGEATLLSPEQMQLNPKSANDMVGSTLRHVFSDLMSQEEKELFIQKIISNNPSANEVLAEFDQIVDKSSSY